MKIKQGKLFYGKYYGIYEILNGTTTVEKNQASKTVKNSGNSWGRFPTRSCGTAAHNWWLFTGKKEEHKASPRQLGRAVRDARQRQRKRQRKRQREQKGESRVQGTTITSRMGSHSVLTQLWLRT